MEDENGDDEATKQGEERMPKEDRNSDYEVNRVMKVVIMRCQQSTFLNV